MRNDVFIFCADLYCADCGKGLRERLDNQGKRPPNVKDETTYDSDHYPKGPYGDGGGEADSPQHCASCSAPLGNPLTQAGEKYVRKALMQAQMRTEVLDGWADDLADYAGAEEQSSRSPIPGAGGWGMSRKPRTPPRPGREWVTITITETICPACLGWVSVNGSRVCTHGPGDGKGGGWGFACSGGGMQANDTRRTAVRWFDRQIKPLDTTPQRARVHSIRIQSTDTPPKQKVEASINQTAQKTPRTVSTSTDRHPNPASVPHNIAGALIRQRWCFTEHEHHQAKQALWAGIKGGDLFRAPPDEDWPGEMGVMVERNGTVTNTWEDGTRGVPKKYKDLAGESEQLTRMNGTIMRDAPENTRDGRDDYVADHWGHVLTRTDGTAVRFAPDERELARARRRINGVARLAYTNQAKEWGEAGKWRVRALARAAYVAACDGLEWDMCPDEGRAWFALRLAAGGAYAARYARLVPKGVPRWLRVYDNGGTDEPNGSFDRYTVVFSGRASVERGGKDYLGPWQYPYLGMSESPFHPQGFGQHGHTDNQPADTMRHGKGGGWAWPPAIGRKCHLGRRIKFTDLPKDCQRCAWQDYAAIWQIPNPYAGGVM